MSVSSISIDTLIQQYRISQRKPVLALESRKTSLNARLNALSELKGKLDALYSASRDLTQTGSLSQFDLFTVSSSNTAIATASASSDAARGTHTLLVTQLAKNDLLLSSRMNSSETGIVTAEGAGTKTIRVTVNGTSTDVSINLVAGDTNSTVLSRIASAVNAAAGSGISASVVSDTSTTSRLVFNSRTSGSSNAIVLTDVTGNLLDAVGITDGVVSGRTQSSQTGAGYAYTAASSLDAMFKLDGVDIIRGTNVVSDVLTGVTFDLKGVQNPTDAPLTLTVGVDASQVRGNIEKFIKAYNEALTTITAKTSVDPDTKVRQILAGDTVFTTLRANLRAIAGGSVSTAQQGNPDILAEIGIGINADGTLAIKDATAFDAALGADVAKVADLFRSGQGVAVRLRDLVNSFVKTDGQIDRTRTSVNSQITSLTNQIKRFDEQLDKKVERYADEFARLQSALAVAVQQQQMMQSILSGGYY